MVHQLQTQLDTQLKQTLTEGAHVMHKNYATQSLLITHVLLLECTTEWHSSHNVFACINSSFIIVLTTISCRFRETDSRLAINCIYEYHVNQTI